MSPRAGFLPATPTLARALELAAGFALVKLLLHFVLTLWTAHIGYSYFRDEFYYVACGRHLAWGYVDHGPVVALQARLGELLFGDSVFSLRILSALAGAGMVFLTGMLAWSLGGGRPAQALAMLGLLVCPQYIGTDGYLSMNSCEPVFWMVSALALIQLAHGRSPRLWWLVLGASVGTGILNKPSMLFFLAAVALGLLLTPQRRILFSRWAAAGIALALLLVLPYALWQMHHGWPTLEFLRNGRTGHKSLILSPARFTLTQVLNMQPLNALLWIPGIVVLLRGRVIHNQRWLGYTYLLFFALMLALHAKDYYLAGIYPVYFAAGAIAWERHFAATLPVRRQQLFAFPAFEALLLLTSLVLLPMSSPVLPPATWVRYTTALHLHADRMESLEDGPLPQFYADRFGWQQQTDLVLTAFRSLASADRQRVCLFGGNYGEAGAIDFLGQQKAAREHLTLPPALSGQNNYWLWGTHGCDPNLVIAIIGDAAAQVGTKYVSVETIGQLNDPWAMPFEHKTVYLLRNRRPSAPFRWADERFYF